jgi:predicted transcriptional regulator
MAGQNPTIKEQARKLLESLPETATWDDIVYQLAARRSVDQGLVDAAAGRVVDANAARRELRRK